MREFGSEFNIENVGEEYFDKISCLKSYSTYVRSGREALFLVGNVFKDYKHKTILMPSYCCQSMVMPFEYLGWQVVYYPIEKDFKIDKFKLFNLIDKYSPELILTMNYYGFCPTNDIVFSIKNKYSKIRIVEDFSHCLFTLDKIFNENIDFYVASIRKSVGLPDGGLYISNFEYEDSLIKKIESPFVTYRKKAQTIKTIYSYTNDLEEKRKYRDLLSNATKSLKHYDGIFYMSNESRCILRQLSCDIVRKARYINYEHLYKLLKDNKNILIQFKPDMYNISPFAMLIYVKDRDFIQKKLASKGVYAPLLWPISKEAAEISPFSSFIEKHMLALPVDQRYDYNDIEEMAKIVNECI